MTILEKKNITCSVISAWPGIYAWCLTIPSCPFKAEIGVCFPRTPVFIEVTVPLGKAKNNK